jgi:tetratricopeptide (TPR) repeat protein
MVGRLRAEVGNAMAIQQAEQMFRVVAGLTRVEAVSYLPALARALAEFARCCQQSGQFERASGMFGSAVEAQKILVASKRVEQGSAEQTDAELVVTLELIDLMSSHALALAKANQLAQAYEAAAEFVELARGRLPRSLPLLTGGLVFMGDLANDLGRARDATEHLVEGMRVLGAATEQGLPGAADAGRRMATRLREAATAADFELPEDVASMLTKLASA